MGEAAKYRPEIDLDEFERRLRATAPGTAPAAPANDPLAELARLVGGEGAGRREDPFEALFRTQNAPAAAAPAPARREPQFDAAPRPQQEAVYPARREAPPYPQQEQGRGGMQDEAEPQWDEPHGAAEAGEWQQQYQDAPAPRAASGGRKVVIGMVSLLALGVVGIGATLGLRAHSGSQDIKTIQADADPAKVKPDAVDSASNASTSQTLFDRKDNVSVAKVVTNVEQPADLAAATKPARVVSANGGAAGVAVPAAPSGAASPSQSDAMFPTPKKVKTVSVRADGTVITGPDAQPQLAHAMPPASVVAVAAAHKPAAAKTPTTKPTDHSTTSTTESALKAPAKPKLVKVASASSTTPAVVAATPAAGDIAGSTGAWAVQLAGSPVESEARAAANKLTAKYADALKGRHATFVQAKVGDKTVYRVRVGHLAKDAATEICTAIKGQGGNCFVTQ